MGDGWLSYSSALAETSKLLSNPPAASTMPLVNKVALCSSRAVLRLPVILQLPVAGSYKFRVYGRVTTDIGSRRNKDHAIGQHRGSVQIARCVETTSDSPSAAR